MRPLFAGDNVKDYAHASKTFVSDDMRLAPKSEFLYHVFLDLSEAVERVSLTSDKIIEAGMMVKNVSLPRYSLDTKTYNAYNRSVVVQSKVKYDPVTITFHDDMADVVRDLWVSYYGYYYLDPTHADSVYFAPHLYQDVRPTERWGYRSTITDPFFRSIRIYQLYKGKYTEYKLINPVITNLQHGQMAAGSSEPVETTMTVTYETVTYDYGISSKDTVKGFTELGYDSSKSPLSGNIVSDITEGIGAVAGLTNQLSNLGNDIATLNANIKVATSTTTNLLSETAKNANPNASAWFPKAGE